MIKNLEVIGLKKYIINSGLWGIVSGWLINTT